MKKSSNINLCILSTINLKIFHSHSLFRKKIEKNEACNWKLTNHLQFHCILIERVFNDVVLNESELTVAT